MKQLIGMSPYDVWKCYVFARDMQGHHNNTLIMQRTPQQIFRDDFRGKLAEIAVMKYLIKTNHIVSELDFNIYDRGKWDKDDIIVDNNIHVSVKSSGAKANYLLIETDRFDPLSGEYSYCNNDGTRIIVDFYAFVNVLIEDELKKDFTTYKTVNDFLRIERNSWTKDSRHILCYLRGFLSHKHFCEIRKFAPRGIEATKDNFSRISRNENVIVDCGFKNNDKRWLQKDNYVVCLDQFGEYRQ